MPLHPRIKLLVVALLGIAGCNATTASNEKLPEPVLLNAEDYRQEITEIDRLVFSPQPFDDARREALTNKLQALAQRVKSESDARFLQIESNELKTLAEGSRHKGEEALQEQLPNQWMRIRNNLFDDRAWFARSAADLDQPATAP
jgi:hypothetical protein